MKKSVYRTFKWVLCLFIITTFIFPWIGLFDDPMDSKTIAEKFIIWCIAGVIFFALSEYDRRRSLKE